MNYTHRDRVIVVKDDEEIDVYNHVRVNVQHNVRAGTYETFTGPITDHDGIKKVEYVTPETAELLWAEFNVDIDDRGIEEVDPNSEEVQIV